MSDSNLFLIFLFLVELGKELAIDGEEVKAVLALHETGEHIALEKALELHLRYVAAIRL